MSGRRRLGLVAAGATLLAAAPIVSIFDSYTWLMQCLVTVGLIAGAAVGARTLRFPTWAQALSMILVLLLTLTWLFPSGEEFLIPTPSTFGHFADLFTQAGQDTRSYGVPVPDRDGLLFVTVLGIGSVAIAVDLLTVVARKPALAGLPMLAIYSVPVAVYIDSVPVLPFIIGAFGFLWLLVSDNIDRVRRFGRRFTGDGRDVDVWEPSPLAAAGRRLGVIGVVAAVFLPLLVPTINGGLLSRLTQTGTGVGVGPGNGTGGRINLFASLSGQLTRTDVVELVRLRTDEQTPYYLRFGVADQLTNNGFGSRTPNGESVTQGLPDPRTTTPTANFSNHRAQVQVSDSLQQGMLPLYQNTVAVDGLQSGWNFDDNQQVVFSNRRSTKGLAYTFEYVRAKPTAAQLRQAEPLSPDDPIVRLNTAHPDDEAVTKLVDRLTANKRTEYDKMRALYEYFSTKNGFTYRLSTQSVGASSEIAAFLETKVGYCQQYAAALAWMAREAGIPARVAFGFTRGQREGDTYVITNRNAHAWTEVYLRGFGWIPFDATPAASVAGAARSDYAPDVDLPTEAPTAAESQAAPGADPSAAGGAERPDRSDFNEPGAAGPIDGGSSGVSGSALLIIALAALLLALLLVPALRRVLLRRHRHAATVPPDPKVTTLSGPADIVVTTETVQARADAHAAWDELMDTMIDFRIPIDPTETPRVTAQRLIKDAVLLAEPASAVTLLGTAEERARYARKPLQGGELTVALGQVRKGLSRSANRRTRINAVLLPPSVLMRWRLGLAETSARLVGASGRLRDVLAKASPRRLLPHKGR
ncbi:transglutaminaseTgpA domain-containing protein [Paractinoplanes brasiliensis]|uniref:Transglutaminase superfamily protein n=1 Tax=Paractinoplanes brasiliensis TaxID=52695 RepID=A0A4R6JMU8_9ACTN|nr:transglutaminaseTgpA domain-containing protein [Actinoplanes brasiliensis]TDO37714.1 transglutaminase superfamily protein [Actinoplanes brasiliensis]GID32054.1 transglutaminase [Actinoplanes brasiliensis]